MCRNKQPNFMFSFAQLLFRLQKVSEYLPPRAPRRINEISIIHSISSLLHNVSFKYQTILFLTALANNEATNPRKEFLTEVDVFSNIKEQLYTFY